MHTIKVCVGSACHLKGSYEVISIIQQTIKNQNLSHEIELRGSFCLGQCTDGVSVQIDEGDILSITAANAESLVSSIMETV
ncbi:MAG TPA: hypothetical protein DCG38_07995 [Eubacteriaceae bacterium]|jgi:NADH:ubiquinone oxidoreductase subunit E|nr:hypothetical protein [Eubacteriaceae bacterium]